MDKITSIIPKAVLKSEYVTIYKIGLEMNCSNLVSCLNVMQEYIQRYLTNKTATQLKDIERTSDIIMIHYTETFVSIHKGLNKLYR